MLSLTPHKEKENYRQKYINQKITKEKKKEKKRKFDVKNLFLIKIYSFPHF